jgi:class 3 adenylate cyclase/tetratricopeptide (TPR) repeat protein
MADEIARWLEERGLGHLAKAFAENGIGLDVLPRLSEADLKELGLNLGDRRRLQSALEAVAGAAAVAGGAASGGTAPVIRQETARKPPPTAERRQVTVLFADITGYTRLSTELDAEELHTVLGEFVDRADAIIRDHGGSVDKHVGDSVMAVFGAPVAHSDDPLRAVHAAEAIHAAMPQISARAGRPLSVHIGIASGQVVASGVGSDLHYTMTGESVNLASRLTDAARSGETLISADVRNAVDGVVDCEHRGSLTVKGFAEPIATYLVRALGREQGTATERLFVGRQGEVRQFVGALEACLEAGAGQVVHIRGEAGIGKTRLTEEFVKLAVERGFDCHRTLVLDFGVGKGQGAVHSLVRSLLAIQPGGDEPARQRAAEHVFVSGLLDRSRSVFLNDLLDLPQPLELHSLYDAMGNAARNQGKRETVAALVRAASTRHPLFLIVEDLHWADAPVVQQLADIAKVIVDQPSILAMTSRIEGDPLDQAWHLSTAATPLMTIDLRPLRPDDALRLAAGFIDANTQFAINCIQRAGGNPLFLEQLLRSAEEMGEKGVPGSVQSVVQARLDKLDAVDKQAIVAASVLGQRFSLVALGHLIAAPQYDCKALIAHFLVRPEGSDYLFAHALVQEGVYNSLLKSRRAELHRKAADWYANQDPLLCAQHLDRADDPAAALAYQRATELEMEALRFDAALATADRGVALATETGTRFELTCLRAEALRNMGATSDSIAAFEAALASAADDAQRCRAWIGMAAGMRISDRQQEAFKVLVEAEAAASALGLDVALGQIHHLRGNLYFPLGRIEDCLAEHQRSLVFARKAGSAEGEALALGGLGDAYYLRGHMRSACERFRACVDLCRAHGYGRIEVANRHMVGWTRIYLMEFAQAIEDGLEAATMAASVSQHRAEQLGYMLAGRIEFELGRFDDAGAHLERALAIARRIGAGGFEAQSLCLLGELCVARERLDEGREHVKGALDVVRKVGMTFIGPAVLATHAALSEDPAERAAALGEAEQILDSGCVAHNHFWFAQSAIDQKLVTGEWDEVERYARRLETYIRDEPLPWPEFIIARGRALASWGRGQRNAALVLELTRLREVAAGAGWVRAALEQSGHDG